MLTLKQAISVLKNKKDDQNTPVHFIVLGERGEIIAMNVEGKNLDKLFKVLAETFPK